MYSSTNETETNKMKNAPKLIKRDGLFIIQTFSWVAQKYITMAEHRDLASAKRDLEAWRAVAV